MDHQQPRHVIVLSDRVLLVGRRLEEHIAGKQRLVKGHGFPAILVHRAVAWKRHEQPFVLAVLLEFFLPTRTCVSYEPLQADYTGNYGASGRPIPQTAARASVQRWRTLPLRLAVKAAFGPGGGRLSAAGVRSVSASAREWPTAANT